MKKILVKIKFITPAFIGGADNNEFSELRSASLKGLLRYWWRALCSDNLDLNEMKIKEEKIFGGQKNRSSFDIRIYRLDNNSLQKQNKDFENMKDSKSKEIKEIKDGIKYLFFSLYQQKKIENKFFIPTNSQYKIEFIFKNENENENIKEVLKALWALENFGGIGARSRRGAGSFKIIDIEGLNNLKISNSELPKFLYMEENNKQFNIKNFYNEKINIIQKSTNLDEFTRISNGNFKFKIIDKDFKNSFDVLNHIGNVYKNFRDYRNNFRLESSDLHNFLLNNNRPTSSIKRVAFGLPINYKFKPPRNINDYNRLPVQIKKYILNEMSEDLRKKFESLLKDPKYSDTNFNKLGFNNDEIKKLNKILNKAFTLIAKPSYGDYERRASPLFIKIGEYKNKYFGVITLLWSKFLPDNERISIKNDFRRYEINQPDKNVIEDFINIL
jgi:CRISPR-associated protein Cmr1